MLLLLICLLGFPTQLIFADEKDDSKTIDTEEELIFTNFIKSGKIEEVRRQSSVPKWVINTTSYSGYFTVNEKCGSKLFFWFVPSQNKPETDPVALWLNGGDQFPFFGGLFREIGPVRLNNELHREAREFSWHRNASLIFVETPVVIGSNHTDRSDCYPTDHVQLGNELLLALEQFFQVFSEYKKNDFYVAGEWFAGHYGPALANAIHTSKADINLKGIAIGNGLVDVKNQLNHSNYTYHLGLVDDNTREVMAYIEDKTRKLIDMEEYESAYKFLHMIIFILLKATGFYGTENYVNQPSQQEEMYLEMFWCQSNVTVAVHLGNKMEHCSFHKKRVPQYLQSELMRSYLPLLETLADNYRVLIYSGQLDLTAPYVSSQGYIEKMKWKYGDEFHKAPRKAWKIGNDVAGYVRSGGNVTDVLVRNAGLMVPADQPQWAFELISKFFNNQPITE